MSDQRQMWPAAKYLTYSFWRAWILVVYSAPIWTGVSGWQASAPLSTMYICSTAAFGATAIGLAWRWRRADMLFGRTSIMVAAGAVSSLGVAMEYCDVFLFQSVSVLFIVGALLTGVGTAFIAIRAGKIYAASRPSTAITNTALSESSAVLIYFFVLGTTTQFVVFTAIALPLAASLMSLFDQRDAESVETVSFGGGREKHIASFARFLVVVFLLTFVATMTKSLIQVSQSSEIFLAGSQWGLSFVLFIGFGMAILSSWKDSFHFDSLYYPLVLMMAIAVVIAFSSLQANVVSAAVTVLVYCLFSLFMWCLLSFVARSEVWSSTQVFGFGRATFALGSLGGWILGTMGDGIPLPSDNSTLVIGLVFAFLLVAAAMLIFRESDARVIVSGVAPLNKRVSRVPGQAPQAIDRESYEGFVARNNLSARECEIFDLMVRGRNAKAIAAALQISENTAKAHIRNIYSKVGVHTRQEFIDRTEHLIASQVDSSSCGAQADSHSKANPQV